MTEDRKEKIRSIMKHIYDHGLNTFSKDTNANDVLYALINIILHAVKDMDDPDHFDGLKASFCEMADLIKADMTKERDDAENAIRSEVRRIETEMEPVDDKLE